MTFGVGGSDPFKSYSSNADAGGGMGIFARKKRKDENKQDDTNKKDENLIDINDDQDDDNLIIEDFDDPDSW